MHKYKMKKKKRKEKKKRNNIIKFMEMLQIVNYFCLILQLVMLIQFLLLNVFAANQSN